MHFRFKSLMNSGLRKKFNLTFINSTFTVDIRMEKHNVGRHCGERMTLKSIRSVVF